MADRHFRLLFGTMLLALLYLNPLPSIGLLAVYLLFERVTGWRLPLRAPGCQ